jgi:hypothetical protein
MEIMRSRQRLAQFRLQEPLHGGLPKGVYA